jgi:hypothetical protein
MKRTLTIRKILVGTLCALVVLTAGLAGVVSSAGAVRAAASYKAVFILGHGWGGISDFVNGFNDTATWLANYGVTSYKFYAPNDKWSTVKTALEGANIVVYAGPGCGYDAPGGINAGIPADQLNGFSLDRDPSYSNVGDNWYRLTGQIDRHILQTDIPALAPNALVIMSGACYSDGKTSYDLSEYTGLPVIKQRIEDYSATFLTMDANHDVNYYAAPGFSSDAKQMLSKLFDSGETLKQAAEEIAPKSDFENSSFRNVSITEPYAHPQVPGKQLRWLNYTYVNDGSDQTGGVIAGNMNLKAADILTGYIPPGPKPTPPGPVNPPAPDPGLAKISPNPAGSGTNYSEYMLLSNPGAVDVVARLEFTKKSGNGYDNVTIPAKSRKTVNVNTYTASGGEDVSVKVVAGAPVIAERSMYFNSGGRTGGHDSFGSKTLGTTWYFAEGATLEQFDEWLLVQNPNAQATNVTFTLMRDDGYVKDFDYNVAADSRFTLHVDNLPGFDNCSVSAKVTSTLPVAAERSMYFNYKGSWSGGHDVQGVAAPSNTWNFAEGCTHKDGQSQFDSWFLVQNPNAEATKVHINFQRTDGAVVPWDGTVAGHSRFTLQADLVPGIGNDSFSAVLTSDKAVIAERAMYFNYNGENGGHDAVGLPAAADTFDFAEGYTAEQFDTFLLLQNPNDKPVTVDITYNVDPAYGANASETYTIAAHSRFSRRVDDLLPNAAFGMTVESHDGAGIMAERAMYFNYKGLTGGHDAVGTDSGSTVWYFAEGYTGW